uniref:Putative glycosyl transferase, family 20 n=1 Tax=Helianthus annuus TaxID=4232 RepID=A0A251UDU8_HELAN
MLSIWFMKRGKNDTIITSCMSLLIHVKNGLKLFLVFNKHKKVYYFPRNLSKSTRKTKKISVPVHFLDQSLDFNTLCALYAVADVALITSVMDGMNLVSYEFVACLASKKGVLVLSEFVGAAQSLGAGAILVNQWNITDVASSILYALNMPYEERENDTIITSCMSLLIHVKN